MEIRGERFNGRLEAFYGFESILEKAGGKKRQRLCVTGEEAVSHETMGGKEAGFLEEQKYTHDLAKPE